jgi:GT2 family glycosyltransferase
MDKTARVDVIVLSLVKDEKSFARTNRCIESYLKSPLVNKVIVVESNKEFSYNYTSKNVELVIPGEEFNYNRFYNIALDRCKSEFVMGPNNDLVVHDNCIEHLVEQFDNYPEIDSLCPVDRKWHRHTKMYLPSDNKVYLGYETSLHMFGCVFMCRRSIFQKIGYLDERFFFFYQDNDYIMCLQRLGILHGVYTGAEISHESGGSNNIANGRYAYTPHNMNTQGDILANKWNSEPFKSGGYKKFKEYV